MPVKHSSSQASTPKLAENPVPEPVQESEKLPAKLPAKLTKAEQSAETRAMFIRVARRLFAEQGYAHTSTEQILAQTHVTRGALYHQFADKAALMSAVCQQIQQELVQEISVVVATAPNSFQAVFAGCDAYIDAIAKPEIQGILLMDAPVVLGWEEWNRLDRDHGFGLLLVGVQQAIADGYFHTSSAEALAMVINGAINEGVAWAVRSPDVPTQLEAVRLVLHQLLNGLRSQ